MHASFLTAKNSKKKRLKEHIFLAIIAFTNVAESN